MRFVLFEKQQKLLKRKNEKKSLFSVGSNTCDLFSKMTAKWQNDLFCLVLEEKYLKNYKTSSFMMTLKRVFLCQTCQWTPKILLTGLNLDKPDVFCLAYKVVKVKLCDKVIKHRRLIYAIWKKENIGRIKKLKPSTQTQFFVFKNISLIQFSPGINKISSSSTIEKSTNLSRLNFQGCCIKL